MYTHQRDVLGPGYLAGDGAANDRPTTHTPRQEDSMGTQFSEIRTVAEEQGISDLPLKVRFQFAKAVRAERAGNNTLAEACLQKALEEVEQ